MTAKIVSAMLIVAGIIHLLPLPGVLGSERLASLYGLDFSEPNLAILMRHRAILLGLVGGFLVYAAFARSMQPAAFVAGFTSVTAYLFLAWSTGGYNSLVARVIVADVIALASLLIAAVAYWRATAS